MFCSLCVAGGVVRLVTHTGSYTRAEWHGPWCDTVQEWHGPGKTRSRSDTVHDVTRSRKDTVQEWHTQSVTWSRSDMVNKWHSQQVTCSTSDTRTVKHSDTVTHMWHSLNPLTDQYPYRPCDELWWSCSREYEGII